MMKLVNYSGTYFSTYEIDGVPHAWMESILLAAIPGSWSDYEQVLNSSDEMVHDLGIKCSEGMWLVPVTNVSSWLFSFSIRNMADTLRERFRVFRRDVEKVMRVAWALPVDDMIVKRVESPYYPPGEFSIWDLANVFLSYGLKDDELEGSSEEGEAFGPLHYIEYVAGSTSCGPRGYLLCEQIQYIEDMPNGDAVFNHINELLLTNMIPPEGNLDEYLDEINAFISLEATRFVGEL